MGWIADFTNIVHEHGVIKRMEQRQRDEIARREMRALERIAVAAEQQSGKGDVMTDGER